MYIYIHILYVYNIPPLYVYPILVISSWCVLAQSKKERRSVAERWVQTVSGVLKDLGEHVNMNWPVEHNMEHVRRTQGLWYYYPATQYLHASFAASLCIFRIALFCAMVSGLFFSSKVNGACHNRAVSKMKGECPQIWSSRFRGFAYVFRCFCRFHHTRVISLNSVSKIVMWLPGWDCVATKINEAKNMLLGDQKWSLVPPFPPECRHFAGNSLRHSCTDHRPFWTG